MSDLTLASARSEMRLWMLDQDSTDPALQDSDCNTLLNDSYLDFVQAFPEILRSATLQLTMVTGTFRYTVTTSGFRINEVLNADALNASAVVQRPLEKSDFHELNRLVLLETVQASVYPRNFAVRRNNVSGSTESFEVLLYPAPGTFANNHLVRIHTLNQGVALSSDSSTFPIGDAEVRWVARLAAARGAAIIGHDPQIVENIWRDLPRHIQTEFRKVESAKRPNVSASEPA